VKSYEKEKIVFLDALSKGHSIAVAATESGVPRRTWYDVKDREPAFSEAWDYARAEYRERTLDEAESELKRRALDSEDRFSHTLLMFLLKRLDPEYRENFKREVKHTHEKVLEIEFSQEEFDEGIKILQEAKTRSKTEDRVSPALDPS
jgi:hypothetical protein